MMTLFNWLDRWGLSCRLKVKQTFLRRQARKSPDHFRRLLRIDADRSESFADLLQPWQRADFAKLDPAWQRLAGRKLRAKNRAWIERPRGHSKTSDIAQQIAWILLYSTRPLQGLAAAADRDQASLLADAVARLARLNPLLCEPLVFHKHRITNPTTASRLEVISSDVQSSWGQLPDFVICDELCHWEQPDMWFSLLSSAAKQPHCLLVVLTNAGVGRDWHWDAREAARQNPAWHFSSLNGPHAPWITDDLLREQELLLPRPVYARLWLNQWQHSDGDFLTLSEAEACRDESLFPRTHGVRGTHYIAAIDYAEKHDHTVAVLLHRADSSIAFGSGPLLHVDRLDVVVPAPDRPTPVAWVEAWIRRTAREFGHVTFILDEYQLLSVVQKLENQFDIRRFAFRGGKGNHALARNLRNLILQKAIRWYPGCGQLPGRAASAKDSLGEVVTAPECGSPGERDDLETELASLLYRQSPSGACRFDHKSGHHDDRAFAVGAAALFAVQQPNCEDHFTISPPTQNGDFNW